jgi:hypothetical protein
MTDRHLDASSGYVLYQWASQDDFLARQLLPCASSLHATVRDDADTLIARVPDGARYFLFHINLSVSERFPRARDRFVRELEARGIRALNAHLTDITKRTLHAMCARLGAPDVRAARRGDPREMLIVKTDLNCGGRTERTMRRARRRALKLRAPSHRIRDTRSYRVIERRRVAPGVWDDPTLVVERYIANAARRFHRAYVLREKVVLSEVVCPHVINKNDPGQARRNYRLDGAHATPLSPEPTRADPGLRGSVPPSLVDLAWRAVRGTGLDFGTIDILEDDAGAYYVVDLNTTPYWGKESQDDMTSYLAVP